MIAHAIRQCEAEVEIYDLLNAYLETALVQQNRSVPLECPLLNAHGVAKQIQRLFVALEGVSRTLNDRLRVAIKEALYVFTTALERLRWLKRRTTAGEGVAEERRGSGCGRIVTARAD